MAKQKIKRKYAWGIRFTDQEANCLVSEEASRTGETKAKVAARMIVKAFANRPYETIKQALAEAAQVSQRVSRAAD